MKFSNEIQQKLSGLAINVEKIHLVGSAADKDIFLPNDYDCYEEVALDSSTTKKIQRVVKRNECNYILDFKCGEVPEWDVWTNPYNASQIRANIKGLGWLTNHEVKHFCSFVKERPTEGQKVVARRMLNFQKIRWTPKEIQKGSKTLQDGRTFTLDEGVRSGLTKLDISFWAQGNRYVEASCIYTMLLKGKPVVPIEPIDKALKDNIRDLLAEKNYIKAAKRMLSLAKVQGNSTRAKKLVLFFNSDAGILNQVASDCDLLEFLLQNESWISKTRMSFEIDNFKNRLRVAPRLAGKVDAVLKAFGNRGRALCRLRELKDAILLVLQPKTKKFLQTLN